MKKSIKRLLSAALVLAVVLAVQPFALALDLDYEHGSIEVRMVSGTISYSRVDLAIYKVGEVSASTAGEDTLNYTLVSELSNANIDLNTLTADNIMSAAATLRSRVNSTGFSSYATGRTDSDGSYMFTSLEMGVYLIVMTGDGGNSITMSPFLVYLPYFISDSWYEALIASPKVNAYWDPGVSTSPVEEIPDDDVPRDPADPVDPAETDEPPVIVIPDEDTPHDALPQTGLLRWPVPVMAFLGIILFTLGWVISCKKKGSNEV